MKRRGYTAEILLVRTLWKEGYAVMRAPASGSRVRKAVYPDIVILREGKIIVAEVKERKKIESIYIERKQFEKLKEFARRAGGLPVIIVRIKSLNEWRIIPVEKIQGGNAERIKIPKELIENSDELHVFLAKLFNKDLTSYMKEG